MFVRGEHNRSKEFRIGGISSEIMALVLDYIYTECITVSENNVQDVVVAAKMLNLIGLVQMCFKFMQGQLCPGNCIGIWRFSDFVISPDTRDLAWRYIMNHFEEVVVCEKFQELTVQELISITEADKLNVKNESVVFEAILRWTNHALEERKGEFPKLFTKIYICGSFNGTECLQTAECYDPETDQWTMIAPMTFPRCHCIRRSNLCVGGYDGNVHLDIAETYNPRNNTWRQVSSMRYPRSNFGIEVVNDRIFTVGGFNGFFATCNVESYHHLLNTWTDICGMDVFRSGLKCCVISGLTNMSDNTVSRDTLPLLDIGSDPVDEEELD